MIKEFEHDLTSFIDMRPPCALLWRQIGGFLISLNMLSKKHFSFKISDVKEIFTYGY